MRVCVCVCVCFNHIEKLPQRIKVDLGLSKCKVVQYEQLQDMLDAKRLSSQLSQQKVMNGYLLQCLC